MHYGICSDSINCLKKLFSPLRHTHTHLPHLCSDAFCTCEGVNTHSRQRKQTQSDISDNEMETHHPDSSQSAKQTVFLSNMFVFPQRSTVFGRPHLCTCVWKLLLSQITHNRQCHLLAGGAYARLFDNGRTQILVYPDIYADIFLLVGTGQAGV